MKKHSKVAIFVFLSGLASLFNYVTYPLFARILPANQFVNVTVSLSLLTQMSMLLSSVVAITVGLTKQNKHDNVKPIIEQLQSALILVFLVVIALFVVISPVVFQTIKLPLAFVIPICLLLVLSIPVSIISGFLNGKNKLVKLGSVALAVATLQLLFALFFAQITRNGIIALNAMALGELLAIALIYVALKSEHLPKLSSIFQYKQNRASVGKVGGLVQYTILASVAVMAVNIAQIADLLIVKSLGLNPKFYADIYVISRVVFFAGSIFIWPFLASIDVNSKQKNVTPLLKLVAVFLSIGLIAALAIVLFGNQITGMLFGSHYKLSEIRYVGLLSIFYKVTYLLITAITLYFVAIRSKWAILLPLVLVAGVGVFISVAGTLGLSLVQVLWGLIGISLFILLANFVTFFAEVANDRSS